MSRMQNTHAMIVDGDEGLRRSVKTEQFILS
jgi:hypothetical protein